MHNALKRRLCATVTGLILGAGALVAAPWGGAAHAAEATPNRQAIAAAGWLAKQQTNGLLKGTEGNYGANIDFGLSLVNTGASASALAALKAGVDATLTSYVGPDDDPGAVSAAAKAAYFYEVSGGDATAAGDDHLDLISRIEAATDDDTGAFSDSYNQWWDVLALEAAGSDEAAAATGSLVGAACPDTGGWGFDYTAGTCGDPYSTAMAVVALAPHRGTSSAIDDAIAAGVEWLEGAQAADGSLSTCITYNDDWTACLESAGDANDTGLAAWALGAVGAVNSARKAASWVATHQVAPDCSARSANAGALMWTAAQFATGVNDANFSTTVGASAQALAGLAYLPASSAPSVAAPTGFVPAGGTVAVKVSGLGAGEVACLSGGAAPVKVAGSGTANVNAPAGTAVRTLTLTTLGTTTKSTTVRVLGAAKLKVKSKAKVKRSKRLKVTVSGLAAGERVTVKLRKRKLGTATADATGRAVVKAKITKKFRTGKAKIKVTGQFANRNGSKKIKVIR